MCRYSSKGQHSGPEDVLHTRVLISREKVIGKRTKYILETLSLTQLLQQGFVVSQYVQRKDQVVQDKSFSLRCSLYSLRAQGLPAIIVFLGAYVLCHSLSVPYLLISQVSTNPTTIPIEQFTLWGKLTIKYRGVIDICMW